MRQLNKKHLAIIVAVIMVATAFIGIHYYINAPNNNLSNNNNNNNNKYTLNLNPYIENANKNNTPKYYSVSIYMENSTSMLNKFTKNPYKYNIELLNETLPFNNCNISLNGNLLKNISNEWYNYIKIQNNNQITNYIENKNSLSMQLYAFTFLNKNNTTYVYTYFNNLLYNPMNIIDNNNFHSSSNIYFNMDNPTYIYNNTNTTNNANPDSTITPGGGGSGNYVLQHKVCDYNNDHSYTQELNQTTYNNTYLPISVMYLNDTNNNTDAIYSQSISAFNLDHTVNFKFNDTTTYSKTDTVQSSTPSYTSPDLSVRSMILDVEHGQPLSIYGIPNSTLQLTNYKAVTVVDYKYTIYTCFYKNGEKTSESSTTHSGNYTDGNTFATLKILNVGSGLKNVGFFSDQNITNMYTKGIEFFNYLVENNVKIINETLDGGDTYVKSVLSLNVTSYTDAYNTLNRVLTASNLFLASLGIDLAIMSVSAAVFDIGGAAGYALAVAALVSAAGSLGIAIVQAAQPISVGENINGTLNMLTLENLGGTPLNFVMYKSEYPENVEYNGTDHAIYVPEPYIYVT